MQTSRTKTRRCTGPLSSGSSSPSANNRLEGRFPRPLSAALQGREPKDTQGSSRHINTYYSVAAMPKAHTNPCSLAKDSPVFFSPAKGAAAIAHLRPRREAKRWESSFFFFFTKKTASTSPPKATGLPQLIRQSRREVERLGSPVAGLPGRKQARGRMLKQTGMDLKYAKNALDGLPPTPSPKTRGPTHLPPTPPPNTLPPPPTAFLCRTQPAMDPLARRTLIMQASTRLTQTF